LVDADVRRRKVIQCALGREGGRKHADVGVFEYTAASKEGERLGGKEGGRKGGREGGRVYRS